MLLTTHVKFAPFATRHRRGYLRDAVEKDLAAHLETALRGVVISDRWPKSSIEIIITILEGEETHSWGDELATSSGYGRNCNLHGMMSILSGCITVASAAIIDAGIDCVDVVSGGVAALVRKEDTDTDRGNKPGKPSSDYEVVVDPAPCEHRDVLAICAVGYLKSTEEIVEMWMNGSVGSAAQDQTAMDLLIDGAVEAASASALVVHEAIRLS
jgi:exosome complex component MTR3